MAQKNKGMLGHVPDDLRDEIEAVIVDAYRVSADIGEEVNRLLREGWETPLSRDEAARLLAAVVAAVREGARARGDKVAASLGGDTEGLVRRLLEARERVVARPAEARPATPLELLSRNNVIAGGLHPTPWFHETRVPMNHGYVRTADLALWEGNDRLGIHMRQFEQRHGRKPDKDERLRIMMSQMGLSGEADEFKIKKLANSIAVNGVRRPPILDTDGTPLDGNRRLAACCWILASDEFGPEPKRLVEFIYVWQLTAHATEDDRRAVVVSLNFEDDCKEEWSAYIKARKVHEDWQMMLLREPAKPGKNRTAEMLKELAKKYAYGKDTQPVRNFLKMIEMADEFKDYHINEGGKDEFEVEHRANRYFQYFDELSKGERAGVAKKLEEDTRLRNIVYDLLYQGKFTNWGVVRDLKYADDEVKQELAKARDLPCRTNDELEEAQDLVERTLTRARDSNRENRVGNPNTRIENFVRWLDGVGVGTLRRDLRTEIKQRLREALVLANRVMDFSADEEGAG